MTSTAGSHTTNTARAVSVDDLRAFVQAVLERSSVPSDDASVLADHLVWADRRDQPWLGVRRLPEYLGRLTSGGTATQPHVTVVADRGAFLVLDAGNGLGQVVGARAMKKAIERARTFGVGGVSVRNSTAAGALGYYALLAAEQGMVGMAITNSQPVQAAWGGSVTLFGSQAFAVSCPAGHHPPLLIDMSNAAMSHVGIKQRRDRGEPLPDGVALTADGKPTTDPDEALRGVILPMAGHRGYGLALLWETLTGVLAGGTRYGTDVGKLDDWDLPMGVSLFMLAVDPTVSMPSEDFTERVDDLIDQMHASPTAPGVDCVLVPGERGHAAAASHDRHGLHVPADVAETLARIGSELGIPPP